MCKVKYIRPDWLITGVVTGIIIGALIGLELRILTEIKAIQELLNG